MGFFSEIDGELKPSDEYLTKHTLEGYEEGDMDHEDYEVEDDTDDTIAWILGNDTLKTTMLVLFLRILNFWFKI